MLKLLCYADAHLYDKDSCLRAADFLCQTAAVHKPDAIIGLGDQFDSIDHCRDFGLFFLNALRKAEGVPLFVYGNHDGGDVKGSEEGGWSAFNKIFGHAQRCEHIAGRQLILAADKQDNSEWEQFALENTLPGTVILSHGPLNRELLDEAGSRGAQLVLNGHDHVSRQQVSTHGTCRQITISPLLFAGMLQEPAGCALLTLKGDTTEFKWIAQSLPLMPCNDRVFDDGSVHKSNAVEEYFADDPDAPGYTVPLRDGEREWRGGPGRLQLSLNGDIAWDRSYGHSFVDNCESKLVRHNNREYLLAAGTWVKKDPACEYESLIVIDPNTGEEYYRVKVIGLSQPPTVADGMIYIVGQWREIIAVELETGRELWRQRSQVETEETEDLSWYDARIGGGWSICPPAVGKHVWAVNARGDLFGYDRNSGEEKFVYPAAIPLNKDSCCPYAVTLACAPAGYTEESNEQGHRLFGFNGQKVNDTIGRME